MDQAKMLAKTVGPIAVASDASIIDRPLIVLRWEGFTALLIAREVFMNICCLGGGGGVVQRGRQRRKGQGKG